MTRQPLTQFITHLATLDAVSIDAVKTRHLLQKFLAYKGIEGNLDHFYVVNKGHSGVAIGTGVDFGQVSQSELKTTFGPFFKKYPSFKPVFESYAGLKGNEALTALQHRKTIVADDKQRVTPVERLKSDENYLGLNRAQTREVNTLKMKQLIGKVVKRYNRAVCDDTGHPAKVEFKALPVAARIALLSFAWQHGPYFDHKKNTIEHQYWQAFVCQDWQKTHKTSYNHSMGRGRGGQPSQKNSPRWYYETLLLKKLLSEKTNDEQIKIVEPNGIT